MRRTGLVGPQGEEGRAKGGVGPIAEYSRLRTHANNTTISIPDNDETGMTSVIRVRDRCVINSLSVSVSIIH